MDGVDLKVLRVRRGFTATDLGSVLGVSHQRVGQIESLGAVAPAWTERYLNGLAQLARGREGAPESKEPARRYAICVKRMGKARCGRVVGLSRFGWGHVNGAASNHHYPVPGPACDEQGGEA